VVLLAEAVLLEVEVLAVIENHIQLLFQAVMQQAH
jgi:hypothetical protein